MPDKYLEIFLHKLIQIKDLNAFFRLLPDKYFTHKSSILLMNWIKSKINTFSIKNFPNFKEDINQFICIMYQNSKESLVDFFDFLSLHLGEYCRKLFIFIINNNDNLNQLIKAKIISYFTNSKNSNLDSIKYFIDNLVKKENFFINTFLDQISHLSLNSKDFYSKKETDNFKLFEILLLNKKDFINNKKVNYLDITNKNCKDLLRDIEEQNLPINFINEKKDIILPPEFIQKIKILYDFIEEKNKNENIINDDNINKCIEIYSKLIKNYKDWEINIENLKEVVNYNKIFFNKNKEKENESYNINRLINNIIQSKLKDLSQKNKIIDEFIKLSNIIDNAKETLNFYENSLLFKEIYESNKRKIKDQSLILSQTFKKFYTAIKIINENPDKIQNNEYICFFLEIGYRNVLNLDKEINWLNVKLKIKINKEKIEKLLIALKILVKKKSLDNIITAILSFINSYNEDVKCNQNDHKIINELKNASNLLKENISSKDIEKIINYIKNIFVNITFEENDLNYKDKLLGFFVEFNKNVESFNFIKDIKYSDIENIYDFFLDIDEDEITNSDLEEFVKVIRFLNNDINKSKRFNK